MLADAFLKGCLIKMKSAKSRGSALRRGEVMGREEKSLLPGF